MSIKKSVEMKVSQNETYFCIHHAGGRGGAPIFPSLPNFKNEIVNVVYEADESAIEQIKETFNHTNIIAKPYCLFEYDGKAKFNMNYNPYSSSLYDLNSDFKDYYAYDKHSKTDSVLSGELKPIKTYDIETKKLDTLVKNNLVPLPDFFSMDVQGAELPILKGGVECLNNTIIGLNIEINFAPMYKDCPLFSEVDEYMRKRNFFLAKIVPFPFGYSRIHKDFRGSTVPLQGEAIYFHKPNKVEAENEYKLCIKLEKLALASLAFGYTEIAFKSIELAKKLNLKKNNNSYQEFLYLFHNKIENEKNLPQLWHHRWSHEKIRDRSRTGKHYFSDIVTAHMDNLKKKPIHHSFYLIKRIFFKVFLIIPKYIKKILSFIRLEISLIPKTTKFEKFLLQYGFTEAVNKIKERKIIGR